jgi:3-mercaptopyruvate sulfurtransferase SseA
MKLYGHPDVRILDCSRDSWRARGYPWSTATTGPPPGDFRLGGEDSRIRADQAAVHGAIGQPGTTLVDVRSAAEYRGELVTASAATGAPGLWPQPRVSAAMVVPMSSTLVASLLARTMMCSCWWG